MTPWRERSIEERNLLNPGFCAMLLWHAALGYASELSVPMAIELSFLVLPFVLHRETRESLPSNIRTSLPTWLAELLSLSLPRDPPQPPSRLVRPPS
jgi:hypothetical protein